MLLGRPVGGSSLLTWLVVFFFEPEPCAIGYVTQVVTLGGRRTPDEGEHDARTVAALSRGGPRTPGDCGSSIYRRRAFLFGKNPFCEEYTNRLQTPSTPQLPLSDPCMCRYAFSAWHFAEASARLTKQLGRRRIRLGPPRAHI